MHSSRMRTARFSDHKGRGVCPGGLSPGKLSESAHGGVCLGVPEGMTHACEKITLPQTSFAGGKYGFRVATL